MYLAPAWLHEIAERFVYSESYKICQEDKLCMLIRRNNCMQGYVNNDAPGRDIERDIEQDSDGNATSGDVNNTLK